MKTFELTAIVIWAFIAVIYVTAILCLIIKDIKQDSAEKMRRANPGFMPAPTWLSRTLLIEKPKPCNK